MKKFRKLVPALCMLLISAVLLGTSTFAWFSMNTTVTATGMQVTAKTDHTYLLISKTNDNLAKLQENPTHNNTEVDLTTTVSSLAPSAHDTFTNVATDAKNTEKWFTAQGSDPASKEMDTTTKKYLNTLVEGFKGYVLTESVYITVTKDSKSAANLKVSEVKITNTTAADNKTDIKPLKVLIVCGDNYIEVDYTGNIKTDVTLASEVTSEKFTQVDIYIYYDGENDSVTTNNAVNLGGAKVDLTFKVD